MISPHFETSRSQALTLFALFGVGVHTSRLWKSPPINLSLWTSRVGFGNDLVADCYLSKLEVNCSYPDFRFGFYRLCAAMEIMSTRVIVLLRRSPGTS